MPAEGFKNISVNSELLERLDAWVKKRQADDLPSYTTPQIVNWMMLYFLIEVTDDPKLKEQARTKKKIDDALPSAVSNFLKGNNSKG